MTSQLTAYITLICTSGVLNLYLFFYVFVKRHHYRGVAVFFMLYAAAIAVYCFASAMGLLAQTLGQIKLWTIIQYTGMPFSSPLGLLFIMQYLGIPVTKKRCAALLAIPFTTLGMVATNDWHHLHYRVFEADPLLGAPYIYLEIGVWYTVHGTYIFACMLVALLLLVSQWKETARTYRPQLISLMLGQLVPIATAFFYLIGLAPPGIDPVPMVMWLASLFYLWAISSSRLFSIMPVAKNTIFNSMRDGVLVLDESHRIIEFNQAAKRNFPQLHRSMFGQAFDEAWLEIAGEPFPFRLAPDVLQEEGQLVVGQQVYQVHISPLQQAKSKGQLLLFTDVTELRELQAKLERQAFYDELTQVFNRRAFMQQCEKSFTEAVSASAPFSLLLLDIDYFKKVNDTYGHQVGDEVLVHAARVGEGITEKNQLFARYGGEEFVLALKGQGLEEAVQLGGRLRSQLEQTPLQTKSTLISVTVSVGAAEAAEGDTLDGLLQKADQALYAAKREGRNRVCVYKQ